jgi:SAM-dependent methyltransferase
MREIVEHGVTGLLVPPGDPEALARAITDLLGDPERRRAMGEAGRARFLREYTADVMAERVEAFYRRVLELPPRVALDAGRSGRPAGSGLSLAAFHRAVDAGELAMARWAEASIDTSEAGGAPPDPHSAAYADWVMATWRAVTRRDRYEPTVDEVFAIDLADPLARPFPFSSSDPGEVANYLGAVAAAVARIGTPPPAHVVEYGTGWGHLALALAATGYRVTAVDINPASVELLRRRSAAQQVPLEVVRSSFLEHRSDTPADAIVFFEAFHHCQRPFELLDRCRDALTADGRLLFVADAIYDDFYAPWGVRLDGSAALMAHGQGWLELGFRRDFLEQELVARGFSTSWEVLAWLGPYGTVLTATRAGAG